MTVVERRVALDASGCPPLCAACGMALRERCVTLLCDFRWFVRVGVRFGPVLGCAVSSLCGVSPTTFGGSGGDRPFGASEVDVQELKPRPRRPRVVNSHAEPEEVLRWQSRGRCGCSCLTVSSVVKGLQTNDQLTISRLRLLTSQRHRHSAHTRRHSGHELGNERTRRGGARTRHARSDHARSLVARAGAGAALGLAARGWWQAVDEDLSGSGGPRGHGDAAQQLELRRIFGGGDHRRLDAAKAQVGGERAGRLPAGDDSLLLLALPRPQPREAPPAQEPAERWKAGAARAERGQHERPRPSPVAPALRLRREAWME